MGEEWGADLDAVPVEKESESREKKESSFVGGLKEKFKKVKKKLVGD